MQRIDWYAVRASGFVAWGLVTASVLYGLLHASRASRRPRPAWVLDLHQHLAALACAFTAMHLVGLLLDRFIGFGVRELLVPFAASYRPGAVAWGVVACYLLVAVQVSSLVMSRLPRRLWHLVHCSSFLVFATTTVHALTAGTDSRSPFVRAFAIGAALAVFAAAVSRVVAREVVRLRQQRIRAVLQAHRPLRQPTLQPVEAAMEEVVRGAARGRSVARRAQHHRAGSRGNPQ